MKVSYFFIASALFLSGIIISCGSNDNAKFEKQTELRIIDSLNKEIDSVLYLIDIDADEINERYADMDSTLKFFKIGVDSIADAQDRETVIYYYGISKNYSTFLKQYAEVVKETEVAFNRLKTLKKSVEMDEYAGDKETFKEHRNEIEKEINEIIANANQYITVVHSVEAGYQRVSAEIEKLLSKLKKR